MKLKMSVHFQTMMLERNIDLDNIKKTVREPDNVRPSFRNAFVAKKRIGEYVVEVVYCKESFSDKEEYLLITAYQNNI